MEPEKNQKYEAFVFVSVDPTKELDVAEALKNLESRLDSGSKNHLMVGQNVKLVAKYALGHLKCGMPVGGFFTEHGVPYDFLLHLENSSFEEMGKFIMYDLRKIPGISSTKTMGVPYFKD